MARRRDERIDEAVLAAVGELLREVGYRGLTMEAVARRAGTTKPAIRRRWPGQRHLVLAALAAERVGVAPELDTGCWHCDVVEHLEALRAGLDDPALARVLPALVADLADDPDLRREFLEAVWEPRRQACLVSLRRATLRGQLRPGRDADLVLDLFAAPVVLRALFGHRELTASFVREVVDVVGAGLGATRHCAEPHCADR
ncbi:MULTISPECIES: TetR/AcrR family transcriptional regulator [Actinosynnema]|uniref:TetR family transcriptional regulator n=1 Tax=Actinosynnema pretiosum TaxID=42197 RepID=A0A290Z772_9PSEU|nr:TetR/AcrR family transcriptional regulator [Actinosynnema pretiosum]ATE54834.1 TetR family transcriptional regulator [Actinosynnema pretiosum]